MFRSIRAFRFEELIAIAEVFNEGFGRQRAVP
jgi:hypothetical protein